MKIDLVDLKVKLLQGGWSLELQQDILEHLEGRFPTYENPEARRLHDEARLQSRR